LRNLVEKPLAEADIIDIWLYTFDKWGEAQADRYLKTLDIQMTKSLSHPLLSQSRDPLRLGYRSIQIERRLVFYRVSEVEEIEVIRVLHVSLEPELHL
jgi:toxin ParE1/3/4